MTEDEMVGWHHRLNGHAAAAAAKSLQLCPTLCNPMDCSLPGFSIHGILQARTLEWVAIWALGKLLMNIQISDSL